MENARTENALATRKLLTSLRQMKISVPQFDVTFARVFVLEQCRASNFASAIHRAEMCRNPSTMTPCQLRAGR